MQKISALRESKILEKTKCVGCHIGRTGTPEKYRAIYIYAKMIVSDDEFLSNSKMQRVPMVLVVTGMTTIGVAIIIQKRGWSVTSACSQVMAVLLALANI